MNLIFLLFIEVWKQSQRDALGVTYFARDTLRSYFSVMFYFGPSFT